MDVAYLSPTVLDCGLRAVKMVALADGDFAERERVLMRAAARALTRPGATPPDPLEIQPITPSQMAALVEDERTRTRIVQAQIIMSMIDGDVVESEYEVIRAFARELGVSEPRLENLHQYMGHHYTILKLDLNRRTRMTSDVMRHAYQTAGLRGVWKAAAPFLSLKLALDEETAARYRALGDLPESTFGRQYHDHMCARGFAFPGEPGGFPEEYVKHDCCHVLGGYDTDPTGECEVVGFICGFMRADPFWYLFMIVMHMHLGIETFPGNPRGELAFDAERVVAAIERGRRVSRDLYVPEFDWWSLFPLPIEEVRARYDITTPDVPAAP